MQSSREQRVWQRLHQRVQTLFLLGCFCNSRFCEIVWVLGQPGEKKCIKMVSAERASEKAFKLRKVTTRGREKCLRALPPMEGKLVSFPARSSCVCRLHSSCLLLGYTLWTLALSFYTLGPPSRAIYNTAGLLLYVETIEKPVWLKGGRVSSNRCIYSRTKFPNAAHITYTSPSICVRISRSKPSPKKKTHTRISH